MKRNEFTKPQIAVTADDDCSEVIFAESSDECNAERMRIARAEAAISIAAKKAELQQWRLANAERIRIENEQAERERLGNSDVAISSEKQGWCNVL